VLSLRKGRSLHERLPATHGHEKNELDVWMEQMSAWMDEITLLAPSEEVDKLPENSDQDFLTGGW